MAWFKIFWPQGYPYHSSGGFPLAYANVFPSQLLFFWAQSVVFPAALRLVHSWEKAREKDFIISGEGCQLLLSVPAVNQPAMKSIDICSTSSLRILRSLPCGLLPSENIALPTTGRGNLAERAINRRSWPSRLRAARNPTLLRVLAWFHLQIHL